MTDEKQTKEVGTVKTTETVQSAVDLGIYTSLSVAKEEIWRRWNDQELKKKVEDFLGGDVPEVFKDQPRAVTSRQIATPNMEFSLFYNKALFTGLKLLGWEFHDDIFVTTNRDKASLGKMGFLNGFDRKFKPMISYEKVIDLTGPSEKKMLKDITTTWGEGFIDFHHEILKLIYPMVELYDGSKWYKEGGRGPKDYYLPFLVLFIRNGILFDNFNLNGYEKTFSLKVFLPAFNKAKEIFGLDPLIVKMTPEEDLDSIALSCYPNNLLQYVKSKKYNGE